MRKVYYAKAVYGKNEINAVTNVLKNSALSLMDGKKVKELMYSYGGIGQYGLGTYVPTTSHGKNDDNPDEKPTAKSHTKKIKKEKK